jgi:hypothetical protein
MFQHGPDLHRRSMRAQQDIVIDKKRILHVPGGMVLGKVQGFKVIVIEFNLGPFGNLKAESGENLGYLLGDKGYRVLAANRPPPTRQSDIDSFLLQDFGFSIAVAVRAASIASSKRV